MEISRTLVAPCSAEVLFAHVDDLARYPEWMSLVHHVEVSPPLQPAVEPDVEPAVEPDVEPAVEPVGKPVETAAAWLVELRAQVGPFARSKRLRMERTVHDEARRAVFERAELDARTHAAWTLDATLDPLGPSSTQLTMSLAYGGNLWTGAVLQRVLDDQVRRGSEALVALVASAA